MTPWGTMAIGALVALPLACADLEQAAIGGPDGAAATDDNALASGSADDTTAGNATGSAASDGAATSTGDGTTGPTSQPDSDAGSTVDSTVGSTAEETGAPGWPNDGAYVGTITVDFSIPGVGTGTCDGAMHIDVAEDGAPEVLGSGSCLVTVAQYQLDVTMDADGTVASPNATGKLSSLVNTQAVDSTWIGEFSGDTMTATFAGSFVQSGTMVDYAGTWTVMR